MPYSRSDRSGSKPDTKGWTDPAPRTVPHRKNVGKAGKGKHGHPRGPRTPHPNHLPRRR